MDSHGIPKCWLFPNAYLGIESVFARCCATVRCRSFGGFKRSVTSFHVAGVAPAWHFVTSQHVSYHFKSCPVRQAQYFCIVSEHDFDFSWQAQHLGGRCTTSDTLCSVFFLRSALRQVATMCKFRDRKSRTKCSS